MTAPTTDADAQIDEPTEELEFVAIEESTEELTEPVEPIEESTEEADPLTGLDTAAQIERIAAGISLKEQALQELVQRIGMARALGLRGDKQAGEGLDDLRRQRAELETELSESRATLEALQQLAEEDRVAALAEKRDAIITQATGLTAKARKAENRFEKAIRQAMAAVGEMDEIRAELQHLDNQGRECGVRAFNQGGPPPARVDDILQERMLREGVDIALERWRETYIDDRAKRERRQQQEAATMEHIAEANRKADERQAEWLAGQPAAD